ncbi:MAG: tetratricopeptide repeat protein [Cyanobacteria bacterium SZAS TMP-1]|nr:tetratricopeptide repeat protein [Cyanobacteria bacterium SZAS TMP-1]
MRYHHHWFDTEGGWLKALCAVLPLSFVTTSSLCLWAVPAGAQVMDYSKPAPQAQTAPDDSAVDYKSLSPTDRFAILERRYFGHGYPDDKLEDRLFRMENLVFGTQTHAAVPERIFKLEAVLNKPEQPPANSALNPGEASQPAAAPASAEAKATALSTPVKEKPKNFNDLYMQAQMDIDAQRYHAAADELEQAIQLSPGNAKAYSLLGNTLLKLQDRDGAKEAFRACFQMDPFGADGRGAKVMLLKMVADDTVRATAPQDTPQVVDHTIRTLNNQAADLANRYRQEGNRWANFRRYLGNVEARKIEAEARGYGPTDYTGRFTGYGNGFGVNGGFGGNNGYNAAYGPGFGGGFGGGGGGGGAPNNYISREISDVGRLRSNYIRTDSRVQANMARIAAAQKAAFVQESAANLKDQLLKPSVLRDDARLKALGTSLYCRYYGDETPSVDEPPVPEDPVLELKARAIGMTHR